MKNEFEEDEIYDEEFPEKNEVKGSLKGKRTDMNNGKRRLIKMSKGHRFFTGSYYDKNKNRYIRIKKNKGYKYIKTHINRSLRRSSKYKMFASREKGIKTKLSELWWEYI